MGNSEGAATTKQLLIEKFGSYEAYKAHMRSIASKGGKNTPKEKRNFFVNKELARAANKKSQAVRYGKL